MGISQVIMMYWALAMIHATNAIIVNKFATKNTYNDSMNDYSGYDADIRYEDNKCQPVQVIAVSRHGIRYPGEKDFKAAQRILKEFQSRGVEPVLVDKLKTVVTRDLPASKANELSQTGAKEQQGIGFRTADRFLQLYSSAGHDDVSFVATSKQRTRDSCLNFMKGFVDDHGFNLSTSVQTRDDLLRFFDHCLKFINEVKENRTALREEIYFQEMHKDEINSNIARNLNISELNITAEYLNSIYKIAAIEFAVLGSHNWYELINASDLALLEYGQDLEAYWELGFGYPINYIQSCPLLADIFTHMDNLVLGKKSKKGVFYFAHAETLVPLMTLLGLFKDKDALRANNFKNQQNRLLKTSHVSPFSANLAFVLFRCGTETTMPTDSGSENDFMVQILFKEQPILLPHACSGTLCPYTVLRDHFADFIDQCNFGAICGLESSVNRSKESLMMLFLAALLSMKL